ncbi:hypothetical protein E4H12_05410 [Candidatus Thorarchaeota archaeon]|nr:MAG: hypothetical protein E4H12_05410 [Candidatus Thorarchaeota archaeon]
MKNILQYDKSKLTSNERSYIVDTVKHANKNGFAVHLIKKRSVVFGGEKSKVNGYLTDEGNVLATATAKPKKQWFYTFVHESCHMDQCIEQARVWKNLKINGRDVTDLVFAWLEGIVELNQDQFDNYAYRAAMIELDCEKRSVKKILHYDFEYDVLEYTQRANSYVYFYRMLRTTRKWYTIGREPYNVKEVWSQMPNHFRNDYKILPARYAKLYRQFCY